MEKKIVYRFLLIFVLSILFVTPIFSQSKEVTGKVISTNGNGVARINIIVYSPTSSKIIAFDVSDNLGNFSITVNNKSDSLKIEVSSIHYRNEIRTVANVSQYTLFELVTETMQLETVVIKAPEIEQNGDTMTYLISSFADKEDRSIEDVLRHMPGIEIEAGGKILYEGIAINKFYVEGLDLMDGKYVIISKNLPHKAVSTIEIMENNQPIRILEDKIMSNQATLNIKLKKGVALTGTAQVGIGSLPFLWNVNLTPMMFTKKFQMLASYQSNNIGKDVTMQLETLTLQEMSQKTDKPNETPQTLNITGTTKPNIDERRYLNNNLHLINFNYLSKLNNNLQFRANIYYVNDYQQEKSTLVRKIYSTDDTLSFHETTNNKIFDNYLYSKLTLSRNVKKNYLNNELKIRSLYNKEQGIALSDENNVNQKLDIPLRAFSNNFQSINQIGKKLIEFNSFISYDNSTHQLEIIPGLFENILNDSIEYSLTTQNLSLKQFYINSSAGMIFNSGNFFISPKIGLSYRQQLLTSNILVDKLEIDEEVNPYPTNNLKGSENKLYSQLEIEYRKSKFIIKTKLLLFWQNTHLYDYKIDRGQMLNSLFFNPSLNLHYKLNSFWKVGATIRYKSNVEDIDNINYGYILKNYRALIQNSAPLAINGLTSFSTKLSYKNPITSFFSSFAYFFSLRHSNQIYERIALNDGTVIQQSKQISNNNVSHNIRAHASKFFSKSKTTISLTALLVQSSGKTLLNNDLFNSGIIFLNIKPGINVRFYEWLNTNYELNAEFIYTFIEKDKKNSISILRHQLNIFAFPFRHNHLNLGLEYYILNSKNNLFVDLTYNYKVPNKKISFDVSWYNILNNKIYTSFQSNSFTTWQSTYLLRPSQIIVLVRFGI